MTEVEIRKLIKQMLYDSRNRARVSECRLCGQKTEGFCNSHTVPQFILKELAQNGKVLQASLFFGIEHVDIEKGISNSGTFHIICRNCDNSRFTAYENEQALLNKPSEKMLAQIELKNTLMQLSKRREEVELYKILYDRGLIEGKEVLDEMHRLDIRDYNKVIDDAVAFIENPQDGQYRLILREVLPYKAPIAVQTPIALHRDMYDNIVNDVYDMSPLVKSEDMHLCIFPLKNQSIILLFYNTKNKKYERFEQRFKRMKTDVQLQYLNYLVFKYTENYYASLNLKNEVSKNENLRALCNEVYDSTRFGYFSLAELLMPKPPRGIKPYEIPNFLKPNFALTD